MLLLSAHHPLCGRPDRRSVIARGVSGAKHWDGGGGGGAGQVYCARPRPGVWGRFIRVRRLQHALCAMQQRWDAQSLTYLTSSIDQKPFLVPRIRQRRPPQPRLTRCCGESQGDTPLLTALKGRAEAQQAPFHVPGHKVRPRPVHASSVSSLA